MKAGVIGYPLRSTRSPAIHGHWLREYGIAGTYDAIPVAPEDLTQKIAWMKAQGFSGFNVTVPYKQDIFRLCDAVDDTAQKIGAVNTVVIEDNGVLRGYNTDAHGFTASIQSAVPGFSFQDGPTFVLGAGGAARAIVYALKKAGALDVRICNRTHEHAQKLGDEFDLDVRSWDDRDNLEDVRLLINTTSLGMEGQPPLEIDLRGLPTSALVCDIVYTPLHTVLLRDSAARGNKTVTGIGMLLHQAALAFSHWTGILPDVTPMLEAQILKGAA